jgi:sterol desaturase/sphingolipid hydroxylase (fatty acid hydroxylase superfamily)
LNLARKRISLTEQERFAFVCFETRETKMTKSKVLALGLLLTLTAATPAFAATPHHAVHHARSAPVNSGYAPGFWDYAPGGYFNPAVPEGNYIGYSDYNTGGLSGAMGGIGH